MNKMLHEEVIPTLPLDKKDLEDFAAAVQDRFNNPFVNHELMSISLNSTSKWKARNMPILPGLYRGAEAAAQVPDHVLWQPISLSIPTTSRSATDRRPDLQAPGGQHLQRSRMTAWALDFYYAHKDDTARTAGARRADQHPDVGSGPDQDRRASEAAVLADLELIRTQGAEAAYKSCL